MRSFAFAVGVSASSALALTACPRVETPPDGEAEGEGEGEPACFIGDADEPAEIVLIGITQLAAVQEDLVDGIELPLVLPPEGGRALLISVRARNVSCELTLRVEVHDPCLLPPVEVDGDVVALEQRPIRLAPGDDGFGRPDDSTFRDFANVLMCPSFRAPGDAEGQPFVIIATAVEALREGEDVAREHDLRPVTITPTCSDAACACQCDGDLELSVPEDEQCATIHDNDIAFGQCPP